MSTTTRRRGAEHPLITSHRIGGYFKARVLNSIASRDPLLYAPEPEPAAAEPHVSAACRAGRCRRCTSKRCTCPVCEHIEE